MIGIRQQHKQLNITQDEKRQLSSFALLCSHKTHKAKQCLPKRNACKQGEYDGPKNWTTKQRTHARDHQSHGG